MGTGLECLIVAAGAGAFAFPMDLSSGPPPQFGRVRVPAIVAFSERAFADAVLQAVRGWQFSPPLHEARARAGQRHACIRVWAQTAGGSGTVKTRC